MSDKGSTVEPDADFDAPDPDRPNARDEIQVDAVSDPREGVIRLYRDACAGEWLEIGDEWCAERGELR